MSAQTQSNAIERRRLLIAAPRDYFIGPVFAATKQTGAREVVVGDRAYTIGGFHPIDPSKHPPALDVRHARALFVILSFRERFSEDREIRFSMNAFCRRYAESNGGRYARDIKKILGDLMDTYFRIRVLPTKERPVKERHTYRVIERVHTVEREIRRKDDSRANTPQEELWFESITLSPEFAGILEHIEELHHVKLEVFTAIRSYLAQAIYLYIPSRAHHHNEGDPFEITLTNLLNQVSHPVPVHKSKRYELFTQNKSSILSQLDGKETLTGIFRVRLVETADGADWKLQAWVERAGELPAPKPRLVPQSKMTRAFLAAGRTKVELEKRLSCIEPLSSYQFELLSRAKVKLDGSEKAFELAKALLGSTRFEALLSEAKGDAIEGREATKTPNHRLMSRIMEALRAK